MNIINKLKLMRVSKSLSCILLFVGLILLGILTFFRGNAQYANHKVSSSLQLRFYKLGQVYKQGTADIQVELANTRNNTIVLEWLRYTQNIYILVRCLESCDSFRLCDIASPVSNKSGLTDYKISGLQKHIITTELLFNMNQGKYEIYAEMALYPELKTKIHRISIIQAPHIPEIRK